MKEVDFVIIGSGQGAVPLAVDLAGKGHQVGFFEKGSWGGSCINYGCTPSKAFLASAHAAHQARSASRLGISTQPEVQFQQIMDRVNRIVEDWASGVKDNLRHPNIVLINDTARFTDIRTVTNGKKTYRGEKVIINTGKSPFIPPIPGVEEVPYLTYESFWEMKQKPQRLVIIGGGYTGIELGQGMARLGTEVHILEKNQRIISREEKDVSQAITQSLRDDGVSFHFQSEIQRMTYDNGRFTVDLTSNQTLEGDALLVAAGRRPITVSLDLEKSSIETDKRGHIQVNEQFQTSCEGVFAIGDVTGQPAFTHVSWEDYRRLSSILEGGSRTQGDRPLAYAFFTEPQVGRVGLTLSQAKKEGYQAQARTLPLNHVARALEVDRTQGYYRMVIDQKSDQILGATLVGPEAAELVHIILAHIQHQGTWQDLDRAVHIHPAYAEALPTLARKFNNS